MRVMFEDAAAGVLGAGSLAVSQDVFVIPLGVTEAVTGEPVPGWPVERFRDELGGDE
jgi:hypothetical protein